MAQRKCRDCGELVSTNASVCPKCGSKTVNSDLESPGKSLGHVIRLRKYFTPIGIIMLVIGVGGFLIADHVNEYIYGILLIAGGIIALGYPVYYKKKMEKRYEEIFNRVVVKE